MGSFTFFVSDETYDVLEFLFSGLKMEDGHDEPKGHAPLYTDGDNEHADSRLVPLQSKEEQKKALYNRYLTGFKKRHPSDECFWDAYELDDTPELWQFAMMMRLANSDIGGAAQHVYANPNKATSIGFKCPLLTIKERLQNVEEVFQEVDVMAHLLQDPDGIHCADLAHPSVASSEVPMRDSIDNISDEESVEDFGCNPQHNINPLALLAPSFPFEGGPSEVFMVDSNNNINVGEPVGVPGDIPQHNIYPPMLLAPNSPVGSGWCQVPMLGPNDNINDEGRVGLSLGNPQHNSIPVTLLAPGAPLRGGMCEASFYFDDDVRDQGADQGSGGRANLPAPYPVHPGQSGADVGAWGRQPLSASGSASRGVFPRATSWPEGAELGSGGRAISPPRYAFQDLQGPGNLGRQGWIPASGSASQLGVFQDGTSWHEGAEQGSGGRGMSPPGYFGSHAVQGRGSVGREGLPPASYSASQLDDNFLADILPHDGAEQLSGGRAMFPPGYFGSQECHRSLGMEGMLPPSGSLGMQGMLPASGSLGMEGMLPPNGRLGKQGMLPASGSALQHVMFPGGTSQDDGAKQGHGGQASRVRTRGRVRDPPKAKTGSRARSSCTPKATAKAGSRACSASVRGRRLLPNICDPMDVDQRSSGLTRQEGLGSSGRPGSRGRGRQKRTGAVGGPVFVDATEKRAGSKASPKKAKKPKRKKRQPRQTAPGRARVQPTLWAIEGCPCKKSKHRCFTEKDCVLRLRFKNLMYLIEFKDPENPRYVKDLDLKFAFILAISLDPELRVPEKWGGVLLKTFEYKVNPDKPVEWLELTRKVEEKHGDLGRSGTREKDPLLDWIREQMASPNGDFHAKLKNCLVDHAV